VTDCARSTIHLHPGAPIINILLACGAEMRIIAFVTQTPSLQLYSQPR